MEKESSDSYIQSLIDEIFETAFAKGNHTLCSAQAFPHSVQWAKSKMIEVIEVSQEIQYIHLSVL